MFFHFVFFLNIRYCMQEIILSNANLNQEYIISEISLSNIPIARRLSELGFYSGAKIKVFGFSVLKKTILVEIQGYTLSLRESVCSLVKVVKKWI